MSTPKPTYPLTLRIGATIIPIELDAGFEQPGEIAAFELIRCRRTLGQIRARCLNPGGSLESVPLWTDAPGEVLVAVQRALDALTRRCRSAASEAEAARAELREHHERAAAREASEEIELELRPELTTERYRRLVELAREVLDGDESTEHLQRLAREALARRPN